MKVVFDTNIFISALILPGGKASISVLKKVVEALGCELQIGLVLKPG